jgi:hypothetical protein
MLLTHCLLAAALAAAAAPPLSERGKLLLSDDFATASPEWTGKLGKWEIVDGAARIAELPENKHAAVRRRRLAYHDAIFEFSFRLDGARGVALSLNNKGGHVCRLSLTSATMTLQLDKPNAKSDLKPERLAVAKVALAPGEWHKVVVEVKGPRMTAVLDGKTAISGEDARIDVDKIDFGIPVAGQTASVDNLSVYAVAGGR